MKKLIPAILAAILLASCAAPENPAASDSSVQTSSAPQVALSPTAAPSAAPSVAPSAAPSPALSSGQTLEELKSSVEVTIDKDLISENGLSDYDAVPEDMEGIIYLSAWRWMQYVFTELELDGERCPQLRDFQCTELSLIDAADGGQVFVYRARYRFLPDSQEDAGFWMAGNTAEDGDGWYRFTRHIAVGREGDSWEVLSVGTGGMRADDYAED